MVRRCRIRRQDLVPGENREAVNRLPSLSSPELNSYCSAMQSEVPQCQKVSASYSSSVFDLDFHLWTVGTLRGLFQNVICHGNGQIVIILLFFPRTDLISLEEPC